MNSTEAPVDNQPIVSIILEVSYEALNSIRIEADYINQNPFGLRFPDAQHDPFRVSREDVVAMGTDKWTGFSVVHLHKPDNSFNWGIVRMGPNLYGITNDMQRDWFNRESPNYIRDFSQLDVNSRYSQEMLLSLAKIIVRYRLVRRAHFLNLEGEGGINVMTLAPHIDRVLKSLNAHHAGLMLDVYDPMWTGPKKTYMW